MDEDSKKLLPGVFMLVVLGLLFVNLIKTAKHDVDVVIQDLDVPPACQHPTQNNQYQ